MSSECLDESAKSTQGLSEAQLQKCIHQVSLHKIDMHPCLSLKSDKVCVDVTDLLDQARPVLWFHSYSCDNTGSH